MNVKMVHICSKEISKLEILLQTKCIFGTRLLDYSITPFSFSFQFSPFGLIIRLVDIPLFIAVKYTIIDYKIYYMY